MHVPSPEEMRAALDEILPTVEKPSRYLGLERNLVRKPWESVEVRVALTFPDAYEIGMSHQGSRILYHLVNRRDDALAERTYAPMPDMARALRERDLPLYTLESLRPVSAFDVVGVSLQTELNYVNVPYLLDLAGIARRAAERGQDEPIVLGGGPCTANPEPVADFFDAILIGDAEAALGEILDVVRDGRRDGTPRKQLLRRLAGIAGVYVPQLYRWHSAAPDSDARWEPLDETVPPTVHRVWVDRLDPEDQPEQPIVPFADVIQDRLGMEIMRGCTQGCRFCQAGYWYRPVREHDPATVAERMERQAIETGFEEVGLLSLSSADYSQIEPLAGTLAERLANRQVSVSLPSLRADAFSVGLAEAVSTVRKSGFTFAPETGSDRLRRVINKTFTNDDMIRAAEAAFDAGWDLIKVYAMIGLPTETDDDLDELARLADELARTGRRIRGRRVSVKVSVGCFVPKAWTPFQWQPFVPVEELRRRIRHLKDRFRRIKGARLTWSEPTESALEALLSRGDRRLSRTIERAHDLGAVFDGWSDLHAEASWLRALDETGVDIDVELGPRNLTATLPWDVIDAGVRKGFLKAEWRRALAERETEDCKWGHCYRCGIPGDGADVQLAEEILPVVQPGAEAPAYRQRETPRMDRRSRDRRQPPVHRRYRFTFHKKGDARYLSHRQTMDALERAIRGASLPARFTEGYNPHVRLSMGPALAVGQSGLAELFDLDCTAPVGPVHLARVNELLPEGLALDTAAPLLPGAPSLGKTVTSARYSIESSAASWPETPDQLPEDMLPAVLEWQADRDGTLRVLLDARQKDGRVVTVKRLLEQVGAPRVAHVTRTELRMEPVGARRAS